jgi:CheY-like chemotaxis protein
MDVVESSGARERELQVAAMRRLARTIAHELGNLVTPLVGDSELLLRPLSEEERRESSEHIQRCVRQLSRVADRLRCFASALHTRPRPTGLHEVIGQLQSPVYPEIHSGLEIQLGAKSDLIYADPVDLEQLVVELLVNASEAGGQVSLQTRCDPIGESGAEVVVLTIRDRGRGLAESEREQIFDPFFSTKYDGGVGLGLVIVREIVARIGATCVVTSEPGRGTQVEVRFPPHQGADTRSTVEVPATAGGEVILLVEDDGEVREFIEFVLCGRGYQVLATDGPEAALELLERREGEIHLLLTDLWMPKFDGWELARQVRLGAPELPVLFMSGLREPRLDEFPGLKGFLPKPFRPAELLDHIARLLGTSRKSPH